MDIASACLVGKKCRYDGEARENEEIRRLYLEGKVKPVCPECLANLKIPRSPAEIVGGDGRDVLNGNAKVIAKDGTDRTQDYINGAKKTLDEALKCGAEKAYLKSKSPSCGLSCIYDGTFSGQLKDGSGVTAALLKDNGIEVVEV